MPTYELGMPTYVLGLLDYAPFESALERRLRTRRRLTGAGYAPPRRRGHSRWGSLASLSRNYPRLCPRDRGTSVPPVGSAGVPPVEAGGHHLVSAHTAGGTPAGPTGGTPVPRHHTATVLHGYAQGSAGRGRRDSVEFCLGFTESRSLLIKRLPW